MNAMYQRDAIGFQDLDVGLSVDLDAGSNSVLASHFQSEYQVLPEPRSAVIQTERDVSARSTLDALVHGLGCCQERISQLAYLLYAYFTQELGLDPVVTNLNLDSAHPTIHNLAVATQANAASSLMALHKQDSAHSGSDQKGVSRSRRPDQEGKEGTPSKKARVACKSGQWETPIRDRHDVEVTPERQQNMTGFDSPEGAHGSSYSTPSNAGASSTPPASPQQKRHEDDAVRHAAAVILTKPAQSNSNGRMEDSPRRGRGTSAADAHAPRTPDSDGEEVSPPPSAASKGKAKPRPSRSAHNQGQGQMQTPQPSGDKGKKDKGLREFSLRVCRQVEAKMVTTYNEVADELVKEFKNDDPSGDEKNIRRRAYDALNVLTAMDIISKDKKDIQWKGFPSHHSGSDGHGRSFSSNGSDSEKERLRREISEKQKEIGEKESQLEDLTIQFLSLVQLLERNEMDTSGADMHRIYLPFVLVSTDADNIIECDISNDKQTAQFNFTKPFELHDDRQTLSMMEMFNCNEQLLKEHLPPHLADFIRKRRADIYGSKSDGSTAESSTASASRDRKSTTSTEEKSRRRRRQTDDDDEDY